MQSCPRCEAELQVIIRPTNTSIEASVMSDEERVLRSCFSATSAASIVSSELPLGEYYCTQCRGIVRNYSEGSEFMDGRPNVRPRKG